MFSEEDIKVGAAGWKISSVMFLFLFSLATSEEPENRLVSASPPVTFWRTEDVGGLFLCVTHGGGTDTD